MIKLEYEIDLGQMYSVELEIKDTKLKKTDTKKERKSTHGNLYSYI